ncbi:MAG TPA: DUF983 domain-containing protein [Methylocystis sp.]|nr:DUF983 domain-containing protein [Methylocystis sp.]
MSTADRPPHVNPYWAGLVGVCPRCGKASMFSGLLKLAEKCPACGLDYGFADAGDAPAIFVMTIAGFLVLGLAAYIEIVYQPPYWVHAAVVIPVAVILCVGLLRPTKSLMIAMQYYTKAEEGRRVK